MGSGQAAVPMRRGRDEGWVAERLCGPGEGGGISEPCIRILLIGNNGDAARVREALGGARAESFELMHLERVCEGLGYLGQHAVDVVLLDMGVGDGAGLESVRRVLNRAGGVPIVVLTGLLDEALALGALQEGAQDYLVKSEACGRTLARAIRYAVERKRSAELARKQQAELAHLSRLTVAGQMSSSLAHELNQPLTAILNYTTAVQSLMGSGLAEVELLKEGLAEVVNESRRAIEIMRRTRSFVRKHLPKKAAVEVRRLIGEAEKMLAFELRQNQVRLEIEVAGALGRAAADEVQITQVLTNLMRNGMEAMGDRPAGERELRVRAWVEGGVIRISVRDRGCGAPVGREEKLFEAFFTTKAEGLGMGLAISRSIVESHGGKLWAENHAEAGMTFHFTLPTTAGEAGHGG